MAFRSNGPITLALPPFRGMTRRIILIALIVFFVVVVLGLIAPRPVRMLMDHLVLTPALALPREPWQFVTYSFMPMGLLSTLFALLSIWFFGSTLEDERGSRWLAEYLLVATIAGGLLAALIALTGVAGLNPLSSTAGMWPAVLAIMLAYARFHPDQELRFNFILTLKAKYLAAIYLLFYLGSSLLGRDRFGALTALCVALCGFLYVRLAPGKGLQFAASEGWFGIRNAFYRAKRRRAAKKFTVYMKKQGKDVSIDSSGRYIDPDEERTRDPNDRKWMN